jgi:hypothetical protein
LIVNDPPSAKKAATLAAFPLFQAAVYLVAKPLGSASCIVRPDVQATSVARTNAEVVARLDRAPGRRELT